MNDQKIDPCGDGFLKWNDACIDGSSNLRHATVIGELQAVESAGGIDESGTSGALVAVGDEVVQSGHR